MAQPKSTLICGDCLECMENIPDKSVDMILCDLPYGSTNNKWDKRLPLDLLWDTYKRVIKNNGAVVLFAQQPFAAKLINSNLKAFRYEWIWEKNIAVGFLNANRMPLRTHENILVFYNSLPVYNPQETAGKPYHSKIKPNTTPNYGNFGENEIVNYGTRKPRDVLRFDKDKEHYHPTQKPVALLKYLIKTYTNEDDTVLDNCMGNGSVGVACVRAKRNFIGIEIDDGYYGIAKERIAEALQEETK